MATLLIAYFFFFFHIRDRLNMSDETSSRCIIYSSKKFGRRVHYPRLNES